MLLAIFCLLFVVIGGVSASDVLDMSNNPDNNKLVIDSEESVGNYYTNPLSNEDISSSDFSACNVNNQEMGAEDLSSVSDSDEGSSLKSGALQSGSDIDDVKPTDSTYKDQRGSTNMTLSSSKIQAGNPIVITLKDKNDKVVSGKKILFKVNNKVYTRTTDSKGQAKLNFNKIGNYKINVSFDGDASFKSSKLTATVKVLKSGTSLKVLNGTIPRSTSLTVLLTNGNGYALSGKKILFKDVKTNKTFTKTTNSDGIARLVIRSKGKSSFIISFSGDKSFDKSKIRAVVKTVKCKTILSYSNTNLKYGENFVITLRKITRYHMEDKEVVIKLSNKKKAIIKKTNSKGQVSIPIESLGSLNVKISYAGSDIFVKSSASANLNVSKGRSVIKDSGNEVGKGFNYDIFLRNSAGKALANKNVKITFNGKTVTKKTNSKGQVSLVMNCKKGYYPIKVIFSGDKYYNSSKLSKTIKVGDPSISIPKIIAAAKDLKKRVDYISILTKDYTVTIDKREYTMDEFAYLMAGAITNINSGSKANVKIKYLSNNYKSNGSKINGKLSKAEYLKLANGITKFVNSNGRIPNYKSTGLGKMEANLYIYAFTEILESYDNKNKLPSSVKVKTSYVRGGYSNSLSQGGKLLNCREIFSSSKFAKYLQTGGKSALNDAIKKKAKEITKGLKSPLAKAIAIFRFVRDDVSYSFYTNSRKGASGTLSSRSGNCCDKANLIVAMCRSVGVYSRYSHAQGCKFQSGLYTGHVWAQVYDTKSQTWLSADATSYRNEVGNIKNWNYKSHYRDANYVLIPF